MEEIEVPTEQLHEAIHEEAHKAAHGEGGRWVSQVALSSALLAVLAAVAALLAGHHANEAMLEQIQASDQWAYYQAKGIKASMVQTKLDMLTALGKDISHDDRAKLEEYKKQQTEIEEKGHEKEQASGAHLAHHNKLAHAVTIFQVGIAMGAIAALTRRKSVWFFSLLLAAVGTGFFVHGLL